MTDSLPLFALPAKLLVPWTGADVQYFGFWILVCCILQAWLGSLLARRASDTWAMGLAGAVLFGTAPIFLLRASGHAALAGHWIILLALFLCARRNSGIWWVLLLGLTVLVHSYLFVMAAAVWVADLWWRFCRGWVTAHNAWRESAAATAAVLFAAWLAGYFTHQGTLSAGGYGFFALEFPASFSPSGQSALFRWIKARAPYEGFIWCGAGGTVLFLGGLVALFLQRTRALLFLPYVACAVLLLVFAVSHRLLVGGAMTELPMPEIIVNAFGILRASGRMAWPVVYALVWAGFWLCGRWRFGGVLALACAAVQVVDIGALRTNIRRSLDVPQEARTTAQSAAWQALRGRYDEIRRVPPRDIPPEWESIGWMAFENGLATDVANLSRSSPQAIRQLGEATFSVVLRQAWNPRTLYLLDPRLVGWLMEGNLRPQDGLLRILGMDILVPGGREVGSPERRPGGCPVVLSDGVDLEFHSGAAGEESLVFGWSGPEDIGRWTDREVALILFSVEAPEGRRLRLSCLLRGMVQPEWPVQRLEIWVNGACVVREKLEHGDQAERWVDLPLAERFGEQGGPHQILMGFVAPDARAPAEFTPGADTRRLGILLRRIALRTD